MSKYLCLYVEQLDNIIIKDITKLKCRQKIQTTTSSDTSE